jgi:periplasmic divalent cation tolerance protein
MQKTGLILVLSTLNSPKEARKLALRLVQEKLAACVNVIPKVLSIYSWKGKICMDPECLLLIKTRKNLYSKLEKRIRALHPYEVPEILSFSLEKGSKDYLKWAMGNTPGSP